MIRIRYNVKCQVNGDVSAEYGTQVLIWWLRRCNSPGQKSFSLIEMRILFCIRAIMWNSLCCRCHQDTRRWNTNDIESSETNLHFLKRFTYFHERKPLCLAPFAAFIPHRPIESSDIEIIPGEFRAFVWHVFFVHTLSVCLQHMVISLALFNLLWFLFASVSRYHFQSRCVCVCVPLLIAYAKLDDMCFGSPHSKVVIVFNVRLICQRKTRTQLCKWYSIKLNSEYVLITEQFAMYPINGMALFSPDLLSKH